MMTWRSCLLVGFFAVTGLGCPIEYMRGGTHDRAAEADLRVTQRMVWEASHPTCGPREHLLTPEECKANPELCGHRCIPGPKPKR